MVACAEETTEVPELYAPLIELQQELLKSSADEGEMNAKALQYQRRMERAEAPQ